MNETYIVDHPNFQEISIGDLFITKGNIIIIFIGYHELSNTFIFKKYKSEYIDILNILYHSKKLVNLYDYNNSEVWKIERKIISLKDKIKHL